MQSMWNRIAARGVQSAAIIAVFLPASALVAQSAPAQAPGKPENEIIRTIYLHNAAGRNDLNDVQTALRSMLRRSFVYGDQSQNAIEFRGTPEDFETAQKIVADLDKPRKTYRLSYTVTSSEDGKRSGSQSFVLLARLGDSSNLNISSRLPYVIPKQSASTSVPAEMQYFDVGLRIRATLQGSPGSLVLQSTIDQSSVTQPQPGSGIERPADHKTYLDETTVLTEGKPIQLGSLDVPGSHVHEQVEVSVAPAP